MVLSEMQTNIFIKIGEPMWGDVATEGVTIVEFLNPLLSKFFSGKSDNESHLILYPMNQAFSHINLTLERAFLMFTRVFRGGIMMLRM